MGTATHPASEESRHRTTYTENIPITMYAAKGIPGKEELAISTGWEVATAMEKLMPMPKQKIARLPRRS
jgi:hypothetical protein